MEKFPEIARRFISDAGTALSEADTDEFTRRWLGCQLSVRAYLTSYLGNHPAIDDCIQEVAILAWKKGPQDGEHDSFLGFCLACAKRVAMAEVRKKYRHSQVTLSPEILGSLANTVALMEHEERDEPAARISALQICLESLAAGPRRLLELRYASREPAALQSEAEATGTSMAAVYKKLERLRAILRACVIKKSALSK